MGVPGRVRSPSDPPRPSRGPRRVEGWVRHGRSRRGFGHHLACPPRRRPPRARAPCLVVWCPRYQKCRRGRPPGRPGSRREKPASRRSRHAPARIQARSTGCRAILSFPSGRLPRCRSPRSRGPGPKRGQGAQRGSRWVGSKRGEPRGGPPSCQRIHRVIPPGTPISNPRESQGILVMVPLSGGQGPPAPGASGGSERCRASCGASVGSDPRGWPRR